MSKRDKRRVVQPAGEFTHPQAFYPRLVQFLAWCEVQQQSERTRITREDALLQFFRWCDVRGLRYPTEITRPILERYQRTLFLARKKNGEPLSVNTQRSHIEAIQAYFRWLSRRSLILSNPAADLDLPKKVKVLPRDVLTVTEVEQILNLPDINEPKGLRDRAILEVLYSTGMRRMELCQLEVSHLYPDSGSLMVRKGKGNKDRLIPISQRALDWLARYQQEARERLLQGKESAILFIASDGEAISLHGMSRIVSHHVRGSGVRDKGSCHLFRHTVATLMLENGADSRWIQALLGHEDISTTQLYTQVSIKALKEIHRATHPGSQLPSRGQKALAETMEREPESVRAAESPKAL